MAEHQQERKIFSLLQVMQSIQRTLSERYGSIFWVKAEMNKLNHYPHSGHCYPDLVEKKDGRVIAQMRSTLWKDDYHRINHNFLKVVKSPLKDGITMLFCARILFDPVHGLSLRIMDIDPVFSLGELERERQETIETLKSEGIYDRNRSLQFPRLPQRIAVISVETSKGYADFQKVISQNSWGYGFFHFLFPSVLQGERAVESMLYQLKRIRKVARHFDVVAIIRGGGGEVGLSCFNNLNLCREIARFPLPVITGIGHATNETVAEMISFKNAITPTDLANYLLEKFHAFAEPVDAAQHLLISKTREVVDRQKSLISNTAKYFRSVTDNILMNKSHELAGATRALTSGGRFLVYRQKEDQRNLLFELKRTALAFTQKRHGQISQQESNLQKDVTVSIGRQHERIQHLKKSVANMSPENVLKRGFSITLLNGRSVKSIREVKQNDQLQTILPDGTLVTEVRTINEKNEP